MTDPIPAGPVERRIIEEAFAILASQECCCEGDKVCLACAAVAAMELLGQEDYVARLLAASKDED